MFDIYSIYNEFLHEQERRMKQAKRTNHDSY
jgi:hypothetical protein